MSESNVLLAQHIEAGAETQFYDRIEIVSTFGQPQAEYAAIRKSAGLMDLPQRAIVELTGRDRLSFLNNLVTNALVDQETRQPVPAGQCVYAFLLNIKGRVVLDMNVIELGERTWLEVDRRLASSLVALLDRFLFSEQVKIADRSNELHEIVLHGPSAGEVLAGEFYPNATAGGEGTVNAKIDELSASGCCSGRIIGCDCVVWRDDVCGVPGLHMIVPEDSVEAVWKHLVNTHGNRPIGEMSNRRPLRPIGWAAFNATRIEAGRPLFGIDFELAEPSKPGARATADDLAEQEQTAIPPTDVGGVVVGNGAASQAGAERASTDKPTGVLPAETGLLDRAVSFRKGCYLGQEVVARMHARSVVARRLVGLRVSDDALPIAGQSVLDEKDNTVGVITSSTMSPVLSDAAIALAVVRRPHFEQGQVLKVPAEGAMREAVVTALPFYRAPVVGD